MKLWLLGDLARRAVHAGREDPVRGGLGVRPGQVKLAEVAHVEQRRGGAGGQALGADLESTDKNTNTPH